MKLTLAFLFTTSAAQAETLGRLFFTPEQRTQLNHHNYRPAAKASITDTAASDAPENEHSLTVNGIVQRTGGKRTAWINGAARTVGSNDDSTSVLVNLPEQNKTVRLKVGQRVLLNPATSPNTAKPSVEKPAPANDD